MRLFLFAIQFLTRLPVPVSADYPDARGQGRLVLYYPLVGLLIGGLLWLGWLLLQPAAPPLQAALLLLLWVVISGALHLDGLADLADGWVGGQGQRERTLEIMKDPRSGPVAVATLVLLLLVKFAALSQLLGDDAGAMLLLAPVAGRVGLVAALRFLPYVRANGIGAVQAANLPHSSADRLLFAVVLVPVLFWGWNGVWLSGCLVLCFMLLREGLMRRLGGVTGDAAGAICELLEAAALVMAVLLL